MDAPNAPFWGNTKIPQMLTDVCQPLSLCFSANAARFRLYRHQFLLFAAKLILGLFFCDLQKNLNDFSGLTSSRVGIAPRVRTSLDILRLVSDPLELE